MAFWGSIDTFIHGDRRVVWHACVPKKPHMNCKFYLHNGILNKIIFPPLGSAIYLLSNLDSQFQSSGSISPNLYLVYRFGK